MSLRGLVAVSVLFLMAACGSQTTVAVPAIKENLTFTGKLIGSMTEATAGSSCGSHKGGYSANWKGTVIGLSGKSAIGNPWEFDFSIANYHGPATYTIVGQVHSGDASLTSAGIEKYVLIFGTVTINKDEHSGLFKDLELATVGQSAIAESVVIQGTWSCA